MPIIGNIRYNGDGTIHTTVVDTDTNIRESIDTNKDGVFDRSTGHHTDQNTGKHPDLPSGFEDF